jgi:hypothetical protein
MPLAKFDFIPGINKEGTAYTAEGGWYDGNLVRFRQGHAEKIGGWVKDTDNYYEGTGRLLHPWINLAGTKYLGIGTRYKLYIQEGATFYDVTPIRTTTSAGDVTFAATNGSSTLTVTDTAHGAVNGDFVTFSGAASLGGNVTATVLNQEYQISLVTSANAYEITAKDTDGTTVTATSSDSGNGGSSVVGAYQINSGLDVYVPSTGWGANAWGDGAWGSTATLSDTNQLRLWSLDNFGEDLIACPRGGGIYYWDNTNELSTRAVSFSSLTNVNLPPTKALQILVSDVDRHILVFGADPLNAAGTARTGSSDPLFICWCDQENHLQWEPKNTNTAGSLRVSSGSEIVSAIRTKQETVVWTDVAMYSLQFIGPPYTFGLNLINENNSIMGPNACVNTPKGMFWMDESGFYAYAGSVMPVPCSVHSYVYDDLNATQSHQIFAFSNKRFDEVGWFYCSSGTTSIDRYVTFNYENNSWSIGQLARTAWVDEGIVDYPRASGLDTYNYIYQQEQGTDADGSVMTNVYVESGDFDIGDGEQLQFINRIIPDLTFTGTATTPTINMVLKTRNWPASSLTTNSTSAVTNSTEKVNIRARARQGVLRVESDSSTTGVGWRLGATRLEIRPNGRR